MKKIPGALAMAAAFVTAIVASPGPTLSLAAIFVTAEPLPRAGLPVLSAMVAVGPPLLASAARDEAPVPIRLSLLPPKVPSMSASVVALLPECVPGSD